MEIIKLVQQGIAAMRTRYRFRVSFQIFLACALFSFHALTWAEKATSPSAVIETAIRHQSLGLAYLEESQPSKAISEFEALVEIIPQEPIGYGNLAVAYLRLQKSDEAETWVTRGLEVAPMDSQLHFIRAEVYQWQGKTEEMVAEIQEAVKLAPENLEMRYKLARHYLGQRNDPQAILQAIDHLRILREGAPTNIVVLLQLAQALLQREQTEEAKRICTELHALLWDVDEKFLKFLKQGLLLLDQGDIKGASRNARIFSNVQRNTPRYQQGIGELVTDIIGHPIEEFSPGFKSRVVAKLSPAVDMRYVDVTQELGLSNLSGKRSRVILSDSDSDGDLDLFTLYARSREETTGSFFLNHDGKFVAHPPSEYGDAAAFVDIDKDGDQDLYVLVEKRERLLVNSGDAFELQSPPRGGSEVLFVDYDHDGDLDRMTVSDGATSMHRNNSDGSFTDVTLQTFLPPETQGGLDAAFGDFDDDGDVDIFAVNGASGTTLYTNLRQGKLRAVTDGLGISPDVFFTSVAVGDYDNDGDLDLFLATDGDTPHQLYLNRGDATFVHDNRSLAGLSSTNGVRGWDARFLDFDNDGFLDLWVVGEREGGDGILLFRNDGTAKFDDVSRLLPDGAAGGIDGAVGDYDNDGDLDLVLIDGEGQLFAMRNDGGNKNGWLQVRLEGVTAGNNKVNIDGIASRVELKAGDLYQMRNVTDPITHFGLGAAEQGDVLRVVWTNGVPQNLIHPQANQRIIEKQILKGSCPFLYVYDGEKYQFVTDLLWRSPLGMATPMGFIAPAETSDYVKISGDLMKPKSGVYSIQVTEELWETAYVDEVKLIVVDHPDGTQIFVDEKYSPPPFPDFKIYATQEIHRPRATFDSHGNDISDALMEFDYRYAVEHEPGPFQGVVEPHSLILDLGDVPNDQPLKLFLSGWIFPTDTSINVSLAQNPSLSPRFPYLQVLNSDGNWQTVIDVIGIPAGKNKTIAVDLTGKFLSEARRVKISTDMQIYWDSAFYSIGEADVPMAITELPAHSADLHYRGFSEMYRPTSHAPHLFNYESVIKEAQWRDLAGNYTRYGDVTPLLERIDDMYVIMNAGDEMTVEFDAAKLPPLKDGWVRDFILFSDGWDKDGDINTLFSQTAGPLPFHGMSAYPYPEGENYPDDLEHVRYQLEYNTRRVGHKLPDF